MTEHTLTDAHTIATGAEEFAWNHPRMREIDRRLEARGVFGVILSGAERAALQAWVTATDPRIGLRVSAGEGDPDGFLTVARTVAPLSDRALLGRYLQHLRETEVRRYQVRAVDQVTAGERERAADGFTRAAERHTGPGSAPTGAARAHLDAADAIRTGTGFMVWDRINHMYVIARHFTHHTEAAAFCTDRNAAHREHWSGRLWD